MVAESALLLKRLYFMQRELVLMQAGWVPATAHWGSKLLLPECLWQDALIAQQLRDRVLELRYPDGRIAPGDDQPLLDSWRALGCAPTPTAFVVILCRVLKPAVLAGLRAYLEAADHLDDGPTVRILKQAITDCEEQISRWTPLLAEAETLYPAEREEVERWCRGADAFVKRLGPHWAVEGKLADPPSFDPNEHGGKPFAIARTGARDARFARALFSWPDSLEPGRGPGTGFELQVRQAQAHLNEIWATEMAAAVIYDLADGAPAEFLHEAARWCYDEVRHCRMGFARFQEWGFEMSQMPLGSFSYDAGADADPLTRLGIIFYFETTYIHTKSERAKAFGEFGDRVSSHDMDFDWADELIHTEYGKRWLDYFLKRRDDGRAIAEVKHAAEQCIRKIRADASSSDRRRTEELYQQVMQQALVLASKPAGISPECLHNPQWQNPAPIL